MLDEYLEGTMEAARLERRELITKTAEEERLKTLQAQLEESENTNQALRKTVRQECDR